MNFSSHIKNYRRMLRHIFDYESREEILIGLKECMVGSRTLFAIPETDFWLLQLNETKAEDIPMTKFGVRVAIDLLDRGSLDWGNDQATLRSELLLCCENLLTFMRDDDDCFMQSQYRYYYLISEGLVFKESELGASTLPEKLYRSDKENVRIARVGELEIFEGELFA